MPPASGTGRKPAKFPWLALILLAASIYVFWVLPRQIPQKPVDVRFEDGPRAPKATQP
jgi:hypothetical protein